MEEETYSTTGPVCPYCGHTHYPDEAFMFDETGYEFWCGDCEKKFSVQPYAHWSWESKPL